MSDFDPTPYRPRNPVAQARHQRETRLQITLPILVGGLIVLAVAVLAAWKAGPAAASKWADISLIWLIPPALLFALIGTVILVGLIYLLIRLIAILPYQFYRLQTLLLRLHRLTRQASDRLAAPVLKVNGWKASYDALRRNVWRQPRRR